ncbi:YcjF family protein [Arenibacterium halophilum]|uniref:TIGR01620 family protein n=1 Tax=Arenibacterium halophilum TaxID=2583821 RepID=A0ABY2XAD0_9RHOB|nr:TIGR01620 family protein [Arenibacterium halophilum]TMV12948.1 TIGR01620 family protein [Arenibacterium halophilum]
MSKGPVIFDLDDAPRDDAADVVTAPAVPDEPGGPQGQAVQMAARLAVRRPSRLLRWAFGLAGAALGAVISVAAWDFVLGLLARAPVLGWIVSAILAALLLVLLVIALRELAALGRLGRIDGLRQAGAMARADADLDGARRVVDRLVAFYAGRDDVSWGRNRLRERAADQFDADALLNLAEAELLAPLDAAAQREVEAAARRVATVTALVPLALADVMAALTSSLSMIRRIAEIYGGRSGLVGSWRLTRAVFAHLVATGAVAVGDDLLEPVLGGTVLARLSRRFGEGLVNGALTARVGVAAMEVCRPLPFSETRQPRARSIVRRALTGLFARE